ncbi:DUF3078 domain-containing protein [Rubrivirga litoralis]|uniref:DUF3078 domain-containing protein n=1 Tax=Rubrivirga litoralis TaxID=3075598 RepID=A0ABU3BNB5_9BACT|nr:DUF3078 domain-containing protein [Rubrivirga sp. F394]MDT0630795.1 DUF3078 domain-containing protein [Rubrivirga sp. F394]
MPRTVLSRRPALAAALRPVLALALLFGAPAAAQDTALERAPARALGKADTLRAADGWRTSLVAQLQGNQAAYSNWQEGGVNALAFTASAEGSFDRVVGRFLISQNGRLAFGLLRQDTLSFRKAVDVVRYGATVETASDDAFRPYLGVSLRTQFADGYDYDPSPEDYPSLVVVPGEEVRVSTFAAPLVLGQSVGLAYRPGGGFVARSGLALRETAVSVRELRPVYGNGLDQTVRVEVGVDVEAIFERDVMENVRLRSRLTAFQGFGVVGEALPDVLFENALVLKVNDLINVTLNGSALYDRDVSSDLQLRETVALGLTFELL